MSAPDLRSISYQCLLDLSHPEGFNASSVSELYGCVFGRDTAITILKILRAHSKSPLPDLLPHCKNGLLTLSSLQGKTFNLESGEEPGKFIHEYRKDNFDRLVKRPRPWYVYPEGVIKNYDSVDSTPLTLIAIYKYWQTTGDVDFLLRVLPAVERGLNWIITFGDKDKDTFLEYELPQNRVHGGLTVQSWTDSSASLLRSNGTFPAYPIAAVEVQSFAWLSLKLWSDYYKKHNPQFGQKLSSQANYIKAEFHRTFLLPEDQNYFAQALDGQKNQIKTITPNPLLTLWATYTQNGQKESLLDANLLEPLVERSFKPDLFDATAGFRTMSTTSPTYDPTPTSYHNGSFWPMLNGLIHEGLENWNFDDRARELKQATLMPLEFFGVPIELYVKTPTGSYGEYMSPSGHKGCRYQAWTSAAALDLLS